MKVRKNDKKEIAFPTSKYSKFWSSESPEVPPQYPPFHLLLHSPAALVTLILKRENPQPFPTSPAGSGLNDVFSTKSHVYSSVLTLNLSLSRGELEARNKKPKWKTQTLRLFWALPENSHFVVDSKIDYDRQDVLYVYIPFLEFYIVIAWKEILDDIFIIF